MSFLVDTNVISELRKRDRMNAGVRHWSEGLPTEQLFLSVLVLGELRRGIERLRRRDVASAQSLDNWMRAVRAQHAARILPITEAIAELWAHLSVPDPLPVVDGLLAATALEHGLTLVTRNVVDVQKTGVPVLNPFT